MFELDEDEFRALHEFLMMRAGFISHELDHAIWLLLDRMNSHLDEVNNDVDKRDIKVS